jgi:hypothetical protein
MRKNKFSGRLIIKFIFEIKKAMLFFFTIFFKFEFKKKTTIKS